MAQENIKRMSQIREQVLELIKEYNNLSNQENEFSRIGLAIVEISDGMWEDLACDSYEEGDFYKLSEEEKNKLIEKVKEEWKEMGGDVDNGYCYSYVDGEGTDGWFPSFSGDC